MNYKYEKNIISPLLNLIKENSIYLTRPENLPQLAKLGFIFQITYYYGRTCWGFQGILEKSADCENNPRDLFEKIETGKDKIDEIIYDAWTMHSGNFSTGKHEYNFDTFCDLVNNGEIYSDIGKKWLKDKTFEDWVILLNNQYSYSKFSRNAIFAKLSHGYKMDSNGYIFVESNTGKNLSIFGEWKNGVLRNDIKQKIDEILSIPELKLTLDSAYKHRMSLHKKNADEKRKMESIFYEVAKAAGLYEDSEGNLDFYDIVGRYNKAKTILPNSPFLVNEEEKYQPKYIDIKFINKIMKIGHQSYKDAAMDFFKEILDNEILEKEENIKLAKKYLK